MRASPWRAGSACLRSIAVARAWIAVFGGHAHSRASRTRLAGSFYASQLSKYLPAGGLLQAASQVNLAAATGLPLGRVAVAFPVAALCSLVAGGVLGVGLAFDSQLPSWVRVLAACGLASVALLWRRIMAAALTAARRLVHRMPPVDRLPSQQDILRCFVWAFLGLASFCAAFTVLVGSLAEDVSPGIAFSAYAVSWVIGFLAVPVPAGVGVREFVLVALLPDLGAGPLVAASLALRLIAIATEIVAIGANRIIYRRLRRSEPTSPSAEAVAS